MKQTIKFTIQNLLAEKKDGSISGPMSPMLFAKEMAQQSGFKLNRLARVWFEDELIHQHWEDAGLTGHDTLIIGHQFDNDVWLSLWVDAGTAGIPVCMCCQSDKEIVTTSIYATSSFVQKLTDEQIAEIFQYVFNNPEIIAIKKYHD